MKLLLAIKGMSVRGGGTERVLATLLPGLLARGHTVVLVTLDPPDATSFYALPEGIAWYRLGIGDVRGRSGPRVMARAVAALRRVARRERPDVAVGFMHSLFVPLAAALSGTGIPMVASEHITPDFYADRRLEYALLALAAQRAACVTVLSDPVKQGYPAPVRRRMLPMPNPVTMPDEPPGPVSDRPPVILNAGRLEPQKDQATLIRAFARVAARFPDWSLRIVGDGALRGDLEALRDGLGLADRVILPGFVADMPAEYGAAGLFATSSVFESFGLGTAEAMAHGLPAVGFADCPGTNELIRDGVNGRLVTGTDRVEALAEGLAALMAAPEERAALGEQAPETVRAFAPEAVTDRWHALLEAVRAGTVAEAFTDFG